MGVRVLKQGFTIVELLIVIVVIAILATISVVAYNGIINRGHDATVKTDLSTIGKKISIYYINNNYYPLSAEEIESAVSGFKANKNSYDTTNAAESNLLYCQSRSLENVIIDYVVIALSKSGNKFRVTSSGVVTPYITNWSTQSEACGDALTNYTHNYRGYAATDTTTGPWRAWTGGN